MLALRAFEARPSRPRLVFAASVLGRAGLPVVAGQLNGRQRQRRPAPARLPTTSAM